VCNLLPAVAAEYDVAMDVKEAIRLAMSRVQELFADGTAGGQGLRDLRLEEVDSTKEGDWLITLSFLPTIPVGTKGEAVTFGGSGILAGNWPRAVIGVDTRRTYKEVEISKDGAVKAIRMRPIVVH
jgi:hypothetical protein